MDRRIIAEQLLNSRRHLIDSESRITRSPSAAEGGCGVLGLACNVPIAGRHVVGAAAQMHNRGNGKGGGIAMAGLDAGQMGVSPDVLRDAYLIQIAYLDPAARPEVERTGLAPLDLVQGYRVPTLDDWREVPGLEVRPPDVWRYFGRVKPDALARFAEAHGMEALAPRAVEDEFVYQNSFRLNQEFYASLGEKRAFVLCHGRDLLVLKIVGYAEQVVQYYQLEDLTARVWIAHQRYPTKGRVWHPGGAHPFIGLNEALVHNGDFANYHAVTEYLRQRNIAPLFLTDTEVSVLLFDLLDRAYGYPLEVTLEALAPTTERDFAVLPTEKQALYRAVQATHVHASPDGPWFFIVARSRPEAGECQLLGITDTSMLRPQIFALYENADDAGDVQLGLIASERQAINAALRSLAAEDSRFLPLADRYWVARGGSHTDGGAFVFTVRGRPEIRDWRLEVADKFGTPVAVASDQRHVDRTGLDSRFWPGPDRYGGAGGGSHTDGGAFVFTVRTPPPLYPPQTGGEASLYPPLTGGDAGGVCLTCTDKFGTPVAVASDQRHVDRARLDRTKVGESFLGALKSQCYRAFDNGGPRSLVRWATERVPA